MFVFSVRFINGWMVLERACICRCGTWMLDSVIFLVNKSALVIICFTPFLGRFYFTGLGRGKGKGVT